MVALLYALQLRLSKHTHEHAAPTCATSSSRGVTTVQGAYPSMHTLLPFCFLSAMQYMERPALCMLS